MIAELAGDGARGAGEVERARTQYRAVLADLDQLPVSHANKRRWVQVSVRWADACAYAPARDQREVLARAIRHADELGGARARVETRLAAGWTHYLLGAYAEATRLFQAALPLAGGVHASRFVTLLGANLGQSLAAAGTTRGAPGADRSLVVRASSPPGRAEGVRLRARLPALVHSTAATRPRPPTARDASTARPPTLRSSLVRCLSAVVAMHVGDWMGCPRPRRGTRGRDRSGNGHALAMASAHEAYARDLDRHPDAITR